MKLRLPFELRFHRHPKPTPDGPQGVESLVIHQDQPRYVGFAPVSEQSPEETR